jgi:hypothetical protein
MKDAERRAAANNSWELPQDLSGGPPEWAGPPGLLHLRLLTLYGLLLGVFLSHMPSYDASAHGADYRVVAGVMSRDAAHDCALEAARGVRRAGHRASDCHCGESHFNKTSFHLKVPCG